MSTNKTQSQDSTAIIIIGDDAGVIDDTPDWEGPLIEYDCYGESIRHDYVRCPVRGAEVFDGETLTASHRPVCRYR